MKKKPKAKKSKALKPKRRIARQDPLPGIGDTKIAAIENAALDYAELRDSRQELTKQESELKQKLIDLMHAKSLTEYKRGGISVKLIVEEESVKVRVKSESELEETPQIAEDGSQEEPFVESDAQPN